MSTPNNPNIDELSEHDLTLISACLDNQLQNDELTAFKKRLLQEPALNAHYQQFKKMDEQIKQQISSIDQTPIPASITQLLDTADTTTSSPLSVGRASADQNGWAPKVLALAATVAAVGIFSYQTLAPQKQPSIDIASTHTTTSIHQMVSPQVHNTLSENSSMDIKVLGDEGKMVVLQSFYNTQGQPCREYQLANSIQTQHAIACYEQQKWTNVVNSIENKQANSPQYQTASTQNPTQITAYLKDIKEQNTINKDLEQQLINSNWLLTKN